MKLTTDQIENEVTVETDNCEPEPSSGYAEETAKEKNMFVYLISRFLDVFMNLLLAHKKQLQLLGNTIMK